MQRRHFDTPMLCLDVLDWGIVAAWKPSGRTLEGSTYLPGPQGPKGLDPNGHWVPILRHQSPKHGAMYTLGSDFVGTYILNRIYCEPIVVVQVIATVEGLDLQIR